ncbi:MAG: hypothetical protein FJ117_08065 [Deltaproteobacteria bacterium]|nr:hypothetical protein [Deltaproteobacteria bacterium]
MTTQNISKQLKELAESVEALFKKRRGNFRKDDFIIIAGLLGFDARQKKPTRKAPKPIARNYFADIIGTNLKHALNAYKWEKWRPLTDDGVTVSGFWDFGKTEEPPADYEMDASGKCLKRK